MYMQPLDGKSLQLLSEQNSIKHVNFMVRQQNSQFKLCGKQPPKILSPMVHRVYATTIVRNTKGNLIGTQTCFPGLASWQATWWPKYLLHRVYAATFVRTKLDKSM